MSSKEKSSKKITKKKRKRKTKTRSVSAELVDEPIENKTLNKTDLPKPLGKKSAKTLKAQPINNTALAPTDSISAYLAEIRKYPLLSREEELKIATEYKETGDAELAQILVTSNLRFVVKIATEYAKLGTKMIDLIQEGNVGLMHAVREFNPYKGVRLISYAVWWIRGQIKEYLMKQHSMVRVGTTQNQRKLFYQLKKAKEALQITGNTPEEIKLISQHLDVPESDVEMMTHRMSGKDVSLDQPLDDNSKGSFLDLQSSSQDISVDEQLSQMELLERLIGNIEKIKSNLNERELFLLEHRLLADKAMTLQDVGDKYGVTREAIRQMEARLLKKIKESFLEDIIHV